MANHSPPSQDARHRRKSSDFLIQEVPDDEIGYDADVEVLKPDEYEELESERSDDAANSVESAGRPGDDLVERMKSLSCNSDTRIPLHDADSSRGRKRRSKDAFGAFAADTSTGHSESQLEVIEVGDDQDSRPRLKRARHRSRRSKLADDLVRKPPDSRSDKKEMEEILGGSRTPLDRSVAAESSPQEYRDEAMDLD